MRNVKVTLKPDETPQDLIAELADREHITPDTPFAFSAIRKDDVNIVFNCVENNPYTLEEIVYLLFEAQYVVPPLASYITTYQPLFDKLVTDAHPYYNKLIPDRQDMMQILYLTVTELYNKGYYLHKNLIRRSYLNALNMEVRKSKHFTYQVSLDDVVRADDDAEEVTWKDILVDCHESEIAYQLSHYTQEDYKQEQFERIKSAMLKEMSPFAFENILTQIKTKTIDRKTAYILMKYRKRFKNETV